MAKPPKREELFDAEFVRRLRRLALAGRRILTGAGGGRHRATDLGDGLEFADHREYTPGDELRYVDWNVFGRLDRLQIRLFHRHSEQQIHLLLDASASMAVGDPSKGIFAKRCVAGLAYLAWSNLDHVAIAAWGDRSREHNPGRGRVGRFSTILDFLRDVPMGGTCDLADAVRRWAGADRARGLAVLVSDCADPAALAGCLRRLRGCGQQVALLHVHSPAEAGDVPAGPLAIVDPESGGGALRLSADSSLRRAYREQWDRYLAHVRAATHAVGGIYACASSDAAWERFILGVLRRLRLAVV